MPDPVSTGMGDHLQASKLPQFVTTLVSDIAVFVLKRDAELQPTNLVTSHLGQLRLVPSVGWKMSTGRSAVMLCGWVVKAGLVHSTCG